MIAVDPPAATDSPALDAAGNAAAYRNRLLEGMAGTVAEKGFAETTVADIVRRAGMSKRTFYEHFASKNECLIALYASASHGALEVLKSAIDPTRDWETQVDHALTAYLGCLASNPLLLRTLFVEILGLGVEGLQARRRVNQELADFIVQRVGAGHHVPLSPQATAVMAMAVVGAINELVLQAIEDNRTESLVELVGPASALVRAAFLPPAQ